MGNKSAVVQRRLLFKVVCSQIARALQAMHLISGLLVLLRIFWNLKFQLWWKCGPISAKVGKEMSAEDPQARQVQEPVSQTYLGMWLPIENTSFNRERGESRTEGKGKKEQRKDKEGQGRTELEGMTPPPPPSFLSRVQTHHASVVFSSGPTPPPPTLNRPLARARFWSTGPGPDVIWHSRAAPTPLTSTQELCIRVEAREQSRAPPFAPTKCKFPPPPPPTPPDRTKTAHPGAKVQDSAPFLYVFATGNRRLKGPRKMQGAEVGDYAEMQAPRHRRTALKPKEASPNDDETALSRILSDPCLNIQRHPVCARAAQFRVHPAPGHGNRRVQHGSLRNVSCLVGVSGFGWVSGRLQEVPCPPSVGKNVEE